jgi:hypothetical protein|nr:MAG TPA: hypothetical protein [Caudoviricetes sp.]
MEMTIRELYNSTLLNIYNNAIESIKVVNEDEFKKELVVNYIKSMNIILLNALKDDDVTISDFYYLVLQFTDLSDELLKYVNGEIIFNWR